MNEVTPDEQRDYYVRDVARRLELTDISPMVRQQIESCGRHGYSAEQAYWSVRDWLEGRDDE